MRNLAIILCFATLLFNSVYATEGHPSLLFTSSDIPLLQDRVTREPYSTWYNGSIGICNSPSSGPDKAFCYQMDNSRIDYLSDAKNWILSANMLSGTGKQYFCLSERVTLTNYALVYDMVYNNLTQSERQQVINNISDAGRYVYYRCTNESWNGLTGGLRTNHRFGMMGALGILSYTINDTEVNVTLSNGTFPSQWRANSCNDTYWGSKCGTLWQIIDMAENDQFSDNGTYFQAGYLHYNIARIGAFLYSMGINDGVNVITDPSHPRIQQMFIDLERARFPDKGWAMYGSRGDRISHTWSPFIISDAFSDEISSEFKWLYEQNFLPSWTASEMDFKAYPYGSRGISGGVLEKILYISAYNDSIIARAPKWIQESPSGTLFTKDIATFRSDLTSSDDSVIMQLYVKTTEFTGGHRQSDPMAFVIWAYGDYVVSSGDPDNTGTGQWNHLAVNGKNGMLPGSRDPSDEKYTNTLLSNFIDYAGMKWNFSGENVTQTRHVGENVTQTRHVVFVKENENPFFVMVDDLDATDGGLNTYDYYIQGYDHENSNFDHFNLSGREAWWSRWDNQENENGKSLGYDRFVNFSFFWLNNYDNATFEAGRYESNNYGQDLRLPTKVKITLNASNAKFLTVHYPIKWNTSNPTFTNITAGNDFSSGNISVGTRNFFIQTHSNDSLVAVNKMTSDAEISILTENNSKLENFIMINGTNMIYNGTTVFNSDQKIYGTLKYTSFGVHGRILGEGAYTVEVWTDVDPGNVTFNGVLLSSTNWSFNSTTNITTANLSGSGPLYMGTAKLSVLTSGISFSDENPKVNDKVSVSAEIKNSGMEAEVTADFYSNGQLVGSDEITVPTNGTAIASAAITVGAETENVTVNVSSSSTADSDDSDNVASVNVSWFRRLFDFEGGGGEFFLDPDDLNTAGVNVTNTSVLASHGSQSLNLSVVYNGSGYQEARAKKNYSAGNYQNWSGYDYLLMDVYVNASDSGVKVYSVVSIQNIGSPWQEKKNYLRMDNQVWNNVTMDIRDWSRDNITDFYIRMIFDNVSAFNGSIFIDNIRLAKSGYVSSLQFPPVITKFDESSEYVEVNNDVTINATVADPNNNIDSAIAVLVNGTSEIRKAMDKVGDYYYTYFTVTEPKKYFYYIYVNDTTGLGGNSTWYDFTAVRPTDITNASASPPSGNESTDFNISANVIAYNAVVDTVIALISDPLGRESQIVLGNDSNIYSRIFNGTNDYNDASTYMLPGNYSFYIWANNSNGLNATSSTHTFQANDTIAPVINSVDFTPSTANESAFITIFANVTDNKAIDAVNATVTKPGGASETIILTDPDLDSVYSNIFDDTSTPGNYSVVVAANDTSGNVDTSTTSNFTIDDTMPPVLQSIEIIPMIDGTNATFLIRANVTDNKGVDAVKVNVTQPSDYSDLFDMNSTNGYYEYNYTSTSKVGKYVVWVWANDTSGNNLTSYLEPMGSVNFSVNSPITVRVLSPTDSMSINTSENASITVDVTSPEDEVLFTFAKVTKPDGLNSTIILENSSVDIYEGNYSDTILPGLYVVNITACNIAGACSSNATSFTANDTINPDIDAFSVSHNLTDVNEVITFYATINDNQDDVLGKVNAAVNISMGGVPVTTVDLTSGTPYQGTYTPTEVGNYTALLVAMDDAGNSGNDSINFTVEDFSPPVVVNMTPQPGDIEAYEGKETNITLLTNENSTVVLFYRVQTDLEWSNVTYTTPNTTTHLLSIPANTAGDNVSFYLNLSDKYNNSARYPAGSTNFNFTVDAYIEFNQTSAEVNATEGEESTLTMFLNNPSSVSVNASLNKTFDWVEVPGYVYMSPYSAKEVAIGITPPENLTAGDWSVLETITARGSATATLSLNISIEGTVPQESPPTGGGGGSVAAAPKITVVTSKGKVEIKIDYLPANKDTTVTIPSTENMPLTNLTMNPNKRVTNVEMNIITLDDKHSDISENISGTVKDYVRIDTNIQAEDINNVTNGFKIPLSWINDNNIDKATIVLNRYTGKWTALSATKGNEDSDYVYYSAISPGFSHFAISGDEIMEVPAPETIAPPVTTTVATTTTAPPAVPAATVAPEEKLPVGKIILALVVIAIIAGAGYYFYPKKKGGGESEPEEEPEEGPKED